MSSDDYIIRTMGEMQINETAQRCAVYALNACHDKMTDTFTASLIVGVIIGAVSALAGVWIYGKLQSH